jgi:hypothetical protein
MAEFWTIGSGEIEFRKMTPVLKALLPLINMDDSESRVAYRSQMGYPYDWANEGLQDRLFAACKEYELDVAAAHDLEDAACTAFLLKALYYQACRLQSRDIDPQHVMAIQAVANYGSTQQITVDEAITWMRIMDDGHGLTAARVSEAYTADYLDVYGTFGGAVLLDTPRLKFYQGVGPIGSDMESVDRAIERGDMAKAAEHLANFMSRGVRSILDPQARKMLLEGAVEILRQRHAAHDECRVDLSSLDGASDHAQDDIQDVPH